MSSKKPSISLSRSAADDLFSTEQQRQEEKGEQVVRLPLDQLHYFKNHPFQVRDDEQMAETIESVRTHGVLVPALVRPDPSGGYEIVSGHRRHHASMCAGIADMPVIVREMDDDTATIIMVDANLQRENLAPSEKAWAYRLKLEAMKRQAGRPSKENGAQFAPYFLKGKSRDILADQTGESKDSIRRFVRLTYLLPPLLDAVDEKKLLFSPAVEVSYLSADEQGLLFDQMERDECAPSLVQAQRLKKYSAEGKLTENVIDAILSEERPVEYKVVLKQDKLRQYFPPSYTPRQMEQTIEKLLANWQKNREHSHHDRER